MKHVRFVLKNGLRVVVVSMPAVESVTTMVMVGVGSRYEQKTTSGISHFLEHMAFKGTKKRPTALEIATLLDGIGAESNAFTSKEVTAYHIKSSATHINTSFDVLSDILMHSTLPEEEINREKGVILEEFNMYEDMPMRKIGDVFENLMFGNVPLGWDILGDRTIIRGATRTKFTKFMDSYYSASNMTLVVVGKVNVDEVKKLSEKYFSGLKKFDTPTYKKFARKNAGVEVFIKTKKTEQTHFAMGVPAVGLSDTKDRFALSVLSAILGGGMSSRLFYEVRERRGLAYYVRAYVDRYMDTGYLAAFAGVDNARAIESVAVVYEQMRRAATGDFTKAEIQKAKEFIKGHFVLGLEDTGAVAIYYGSDEMLECAIEDPSGVLAKIDRVTDADVVRVAKKYLSQPFKLAVIGNYKDTAQFEEIISS